MTASRALDAHEIVANQEAQRAWEAVTKGIEAYLMDRVNNRDHVTAEQCLRIVQADIARVPVSAQQYLAARWHQYSAQREQIEALKASQAELLDIAKRILERGYVDRQLSGGRADHEALVAAIANANGEAK